MSNEKGSDLLLTQGSAIGSFLPIVPMKKLPLVLVLCATPAWAQITVTPDSSTAPGATPSARSVKREAAAARPIPRAVPVHAAVPSPSPTPAPKRKRGFFSFFWRIFGGGRSEEKTTVEVKPTPKPTATPKPKPAPKLTPTPKPTAKPTATPQASPTPTPKPTATPAPTATPKPQPTPEIPVVGNSPQMDLPKEASEAQYLKIKKQALKDPQVDALLKKMAAAAEDEDAYKAAAHEYVQALFAKMRKLDPSITRKIDTKERATRRFIDSGRPFLQ